MLKRARCRQHVNPYMANSGGRTARNRLSVELPPPLSYITAVVYVYNHGRVVCSAHSAKSMQMSSSSSVVLLFKETQK